jgi:hypothetical protein
MKVDRSQLPMPHGCDIKRNDKTCAFHLPRSGNSPVSLKICIYEITDSAHEKLLGIAIFTDPMKLVVHPECALLIQSSLSSAIQQMVHTYLISLHFELSYFRH